MIYSTGELLAKYQNYTDGKGKIHRDTANGVLFIVTHGLYETDKNAIGERLASYIYGPSYLSFDYVLSINGLIPERVYKTYTSATKNKRKTKIYTNMFGTYTYEDVPEEVFSLGIRVIHEDGYTYQIASLEKALCDKLYSLTPVRSMKKLESLLFNDLRIDEELFSELDMEEIEKIAPLYHSTNLYLLVKYIKRHYGSRLEREIEPI